MSVKKLSLETALDQIEECLDLAQPGEAPFVLVLGSGFSHGLVPTARELVNESLPLWRRWKKAGTNTQFHEFCKAVSPQDRNAFAREFWDEFIEKNNVFARLSVDTSTGLPLNTSEAYKLAFDHTLLKGVGDPTSAREFQRDLMRLDDPRLNAAHFLLGSLLGVQPGKRRTSAHFKRQAAFSRLILTTNFDPFLQIALQMVNRLYFMSDTPELGVNDEIFDDEIDAIHLVYLHGSVHRRAQHATEESIHKLKVKNAHTLSPVLKKRGIIVLGYSGWDDTLVEALSGCDTFGHRLYWCGLREDPFPGNSYGPRVKDILDKSSAFYVHTPGGAGKFMALLFNRLVNGIPRLLDNPIVQLREMIETINLRELDSAPTTIPTDPQQPIIDSAEKDAFCKAFARTLRGLKSIENDFMSICSGEKILELRSKIEKTHRGNFEGFLIKISLTAAMGNHEEVLKLVREAREMGDLDSNENAELLKISFVAEYHLEQFDECLASLTDLIAIPSRPVEEIAKALFNRGLVYGQQEDTDKAFADYTHVIDQLPGAPAEQVVLSLVSRGILLGKRGETDKALADYTRAIDQLPGVPAAHLAVALVNRGFIFAQKGETEKALADFTRVVDQLPGAPVEQIAKALINRGVLFKRKGETNKTLADFNRVIDQLPGALDKEIAMGLVSRGVVFEQKGETNKALADFTRVIDQVQGAPAEQIAEALISRGDIFSQSETKKALADYSRVIDQLPGAPVKLVAQALLNRAQIFGQKDETEKALADYTRVIDQLPGAPVEVIATALAYRAWCYYVRNDYTRFRLDTKAALERSDNLDFAAYNLGLALLANHEDESAEMAYRAAATKWPGRIEMGLFDLKEAASDWLDQPRAKKFIALLESLKPKP
jgi:tetratricopeptide (TPR) repeat protein